MTDISRPGVAASQLRDVNRGISGPVIMRAEGVVKDERGLPERANDRPTVAASVELELVGVGVLENVPVSQPEHIGRFLVLGPGPSEGALHCDGFAQ